LRAHLNEWHRKAAELHTQRDPLSRDLAVLEERRRSLTAQQASILSDQESAMNELHLARERYQAAEAELPVCRPSSTKPKPQNENAQNALSTRQSERSGIEEQINSIRNQIETLTQQRAENNARLR
jgi:peptidoglycan hydrolase CwlO-like protein